MDEGKISVRYAKALLASVREKQLTESVRLDMEMIFNIIETEPRFNNVLQSPVIKTSIKASFFKAVFYEQINPVTFSFLMLLLSNNRERYLKSATRIFLDLCRKEAGYKKAQLTSAVPINQALTDQFTNFIREYFKSEVDLTCLTDENIIGGFVLQVGDQQIDASVASKIKKIKRELLGSQS